MTSLLTSDSEPEMTARAKNRALLLLAMTQFVIVIDASIVNVALPSIGTHLHFSQDNLTWVVNAYTLTFGGFLLLGGRMADLLGRRRMFMLGLVVFSLACAIPWAMWKSLGVAKVHDKMVYDDAAPLAAMRRAMTKAGTGP